MIGYSDAEIPLVPGALYGVRGFRTHSDGRLGPLHRSEGLRYGAGVHTADCDMSNVRIVFNLAGKEYILNSGKNELNSTHPDKPAPQRHCTCGFYAYFSDTQETTFIDGTDKVVGIVRATGRAIVGNLGFRCEKMEIVGLVCDYPKSASRKQRIKEYLFETASMFLKIPFKNTVIGLLMYWAVIFLDIFVDHPVVKFANTCAVTLMWCWLLFSLVMFGVLFWREKTDAGKDERRPPKALSEKIKTQYPDIQFFSSLEDAKAHFPISKSTDLPQ